MMPRNAYLPTLPLLYMLTTRRCMQPSLLTLTLTKHHLYSRNLSTLLTDGAVPGVFSLSQRNHKVCFSTTIAQAGLHPRFSLVGSRFPTPRSWSCWELPLTLNCSTKSTFGILPVEQTSASTFSGEQYQFLALQIAWPSTKVLYGPS